MGRWFMRLSYRGAPYHGWQTQPGAVTVQETLEQAMAKVLRLPACPVTGAGRTDAGVNARLMVAHFDLPDGHPFDPRGLARALNSIVGPDIAVHSVCEVPADLHARFSATSRTYRYYTLPGKDAFVHPLVWRAPATLDYEAMNRAAAILLETEDFTSFAKLHSDAKTNICHVSRAEWMPWEAFDGARGMVFEITADRFLRNMVRAVVGTLVEVGRGKLTVDGFRDVIRRKDRCAAGTSMPGHALYLWDVTYPADLPENLC